MVQNQVFIAVDFGGYKTSKLLLPFGFLVNFFLSSFFLFLTLFLAYFLSLSLFPANANILYSYNHPYHSRHLDHMGHSWRQ